MTLSKIAIGCIIALPGLTLMESSQAAEVGNGFEFFGYFRAGVLTSANDVDYERVEWAATKEMVGRLGIEGDNDYSVGLSKLWTLNDGKTAKVIVGFDDEDDYSASTFPTAYVELNGISNSGTLWGGKRDYQKDDNYVFMTDFYYEDYSGTGFGISDFTLGNAKVDVAYIASDLAEDDDDDDDDSDYRLMHTLYMGYTNGHFKIDGSVKFMGDNGTSTAGYWNDADSYWVDETNVDYAKTGFDLSAAYSMDSFFGLNGKGNSKIIGQVGRGLGAQQLLGGTLTTYNAYRPGSVTKGGSDGEDTISENYEGDTSARVILWGGYYFDNGVNLFPSIQAQYNDHQEENIYDYWASAMIRPTFPMTDNSYLQTEFGYAYKNWNGGSWTEQKATFAPTIVMGTGTSASPEIRFPLSFVKVAGDSDVIIGVQTEISW